MDSNKVSKSTRTDTDSPNEENISSDYDIYNYNQSAERILYEIETYLKQRSLPTIILNTDHIVFKFNSNDVCPKPGYFINNIFNGPSNDHNYFKKNANKFKPIMKQINLIAVRYNGTIILKKGKKKDTILMDNPDYILVFHRNIKK
jgi:hypothetical protein